MPTVKWVEYKGYSGLMVRGEEPWLDPMSIPNGATHLGRAVWLAAQLEAPKWGSVQGYDGAGMSAGLLHNVAVTPADMKQGSLWALVRKIFDMGNQGSAQKLRRAFVEQGWAISPDGVLRVFQPALLEETGLPISGHEIRAVLTPHNGKVPKTGPHREKAERWALLFHEVFADSGTRHAQALYAATWMARGQSDLEMQAYRRFTGLPTLDSPMALIPQQLPEPVEFAMCVYHAFSVNAPGPAAKALKAALTEPPSTSGNGPEKFMKKLIRLFGRSDYGRWKDEPGDGNNRYDRTRKAVWSKPDIWPNGRVWMPRDV